MSKSTNNNAKVEAERKKPVRRTEVERAEALRQQIADIEAKLEAKDAKRAGEIRARVAVLDERAAKIADDRGALLDELDEIVTRVPELAEEPVDQLPDVTE